MGIAILALIYSCFPEISPSAMECKARPIDPYLLTFIVVVWRKSCISWASLTQQRAGEHLLVDN